MTQPARLPKPQSVPERRTRLAAQLLAILKSSDDFEWACAIIEQGGSGGKIVLTIDAGGYVKFISQEAGRRVS